MNLGRRVSKLEKVHAATHPPRVIVRYEGPGAEKFPQPKEEADENTMVIVVQYVSAGDGGPA